LRLRRIEPVLREALGAACRVPPGSRVLVAASGGADSTALLLGLHRIAHEFGLEVEAAHLHHRLRGAEADGDLEHVRGLCLRLGVALHAARWNARARMRSRKLSGQAGLRTLRREYLEGVARRRGAAFIATAHTADDQLETVLLRLARGTGLRGLGGIRPRSGRWIRPLLAAPRAWIESDLTRAGVAWREDSSNADTGYARNRIRHRVIPALGEAGAGLALRGAAAASEARAADDALRILARRAVRNAARIEGGRAEIESVRLASFPYALRRRILSEMWSTMTGNAIGLTRRHLGVLDRMCRSTRARARTLLPAGWRAERDRGILTLRRDGSPRPGAAGRTPGAAPRGARRPSGPAAAPPGWRCAPAGPMIASHPLARRGPSRATERA
jgi:tRNA(Ile)-lysidine synthase